MVAGLIQGPHHCRPVRFSIEQFRALGTGACDRGLGAEILDVDSHDSFAEHLNPSLGRTIIAAHIADVKMPADRLAVDRVG